MCPGIVYPDEIDTTNIFFIVGGAFAGLDKIISARTQGTSMGFGATVRGPDERGTGDVVEGRARPLYTYSDKGMREQTAS